MPCSCLGPLASPWDPLQEWENEEGSGVAFPPCCDCKPYQEWCKVLLSWWQSKEKLLGARTV